VAVPVIRGGGAMRGAMRGMARGGRGAMRGVPAMRGRGAAMRG